MRRLLLLLLIAVLCAAPAAVYAETITWVPETTITGTAADMSNIVTSGQWAQSGVSMNYSVVLDTTTNMFLYTYDFHVLGDTKAISHLVIEVSHDDTATLDVNEGFVVEGLDWANTNLTQFKSPTVGWWDPSDPSNPDMLASIYGVKFDVADDLTLTEAVIQFWSDRVPMEGDFYAKDGYTNKLAAWNTAQDSSIGPLLDVEWEQGVATVTGGKIPVPNSHTFGPPPAPEPSCAMALAGMALVGLCLGLRRRRG